MTVLKVFRWIVLDVWTVLRGSVLGVRTVLTVLTVLRFESLVFAQI